MKVKFLLLCLGVSFFGKAQDDKIKLDRQEKNYYQYDTDFLPASFHQEKREALRNLLPDSSVAIVFAGPVRNRANDVYFEYHQDPNFYYLTGLREPNAVLLIYKEPQQIDSITTSNEILFLQERDPGSELWNGRRLGVDRGMETLMIQTLKSNEEFADFDPLFGVLDKVFYIDPNDPEQRSTKKTDNLYALHEAFRDKLKDANNSSGQSLATSLAKLRQVKTKEEIELLRKAISITCEAQNELMKSIKEDMTEYQTEAIIEYVFKSNGAEYPGFPSIQGSGENSCILHYTSNRRPLNNGGLLVSDVGAEYRGYTADVTRTIPPDGKFSKEEKIIYNLVLKAQDAGIEASKVGASFWAAHLAAQAVIKEGLLKLKIIDKPFDVKNYFMHGTSHYLGLDVHDAGLYGPLEAGNVITVEPGIYIAEGADCDPKWWNIGVRIEDDILIANEGPENLSAASPRTIKEIEAMMAKKEGEFIK